MSTQSPDGKPHPGYILQYLDAFAAAHPNSPLPEVWDRGNGWVHYRFGNNPTTSLRPSEIRALTKDLKARAQ